jgi:hypothetical protein
MALLRPAPRRLREPCRKEIPACEHSSFIAGAEIFAAGGIAAGRLGSGIGPVFPLLLPAVAKGEE